MKLLPPYDPDMAYPLIDGIEYPYNIKEAATYFMKSGCNFMVGYGLSDQIRDLNREKRERLTRYNFLP